MNLDELISHAVGQDILGYIVERHIGRGAIGDMFYAYNADISDTRAIKFIPMSKLRDGWKNEIIKVNKLKRHEKIVQYHVHGEIELNGEQFLYIMWDYVENDSLKRLIEKSELTIPLLVDTLRSSLEVLHACSVAEIIHADLHSGNILIEKENTFNIDSSYRRILITDFGRLTHESKADFLDDFVGLNRMLQEALRSINFSMLDGEGKRIHRMLNNDYTKCLSETNVTVDECARNPQKLLHRLEMLLNPHQGSSGPSFGGISDYLAAESLGDNFDEWKAIFVPKFIATDELLQRNICVLTGLRGCGKTMLFKRLSSYFNLRIGEVAGLNGADSFYSFYFNARHIAEAFPWLPDDSQEKARSQVVNNFNLNWCQEILIWLKEISKIKQINLSFLNIFFKKYFPSYFSTGSSQNIYYLIDLIKNEIDKSRLRSGYNDSFEWPLGQYDFLDTLIEEIKNAGIVDNLKPFYFFLDDYSLPMVKTTLQKILNPVIFRRSSHAIFKISTESAESFVTTSLNGKMLEENDDYSLIDCGSLALGKVSKSKCQEILFSILQPRIERHPLLKDRNLTLHKILGDTKLNNEQRAAIIRKDTSAELAGLSTTHLYQGWNVFSDMWSSDVREMINLFAEMVSREEEEKLLATSGQLISDSIQSDIYVEAGGQFMALLKAATNPSENVYLDKEHRYARHLVEIVEAFNRVASHDLKNKNSKNQDRNPIKKARRIEVTNVEGDLPPEADDYYKGLIRYGIFIRDYRGKSVRGRIVPRLYLRSRLVPYFKLTFSKRDSISMPWEDFLQFLLDPKAYAEAYIKKGEGAGKSGASPKGEQYSLLSLVEKS